VAGRRSVGELQDNSKRDETGPLRSERRERRFPLSIPLLIFGFDAGCRLFRDAVSTLNISRSGCCLRMRKRPMVDSVLAVRVVPREGPVPDHPRFLYQVAWFRQEGESWMVGAFALGDADLAR
jgi:hypothetical protein